MALQDIPFRIPDRWSSTWFRTFIVEYLAKADVRNAIGEGAVITSSQNSVATISTVEGNNSQLTRHNEDPFSHVAAFTAHRAEANPHPQYDLESLAFFLGE